MIDKDNITSEEFTRLEAHAVEQAMHYARAEAALYAKDADLDAATLAILWQALEQEAIKQGIPMNVLIGGHNEL